MGDNFSEPLTIRLSRSSRRKVVALAEKNATTTAAIVRQIVDDHLAGNDIEHRIRTAHEQTLKRTMESVVSSVEEAMTFAIEKITSGGSARASSERRLAQATAQGTGFWSPSCADADRLLPSASEGKKARKQYNLVLLMQGAYDNEITDAIDQEAGRRYDRRYPGDTDTDRDKLGRIILEVLNEGWRPGMPMRVPG